MVTIGDLISNSFDPVLQIKLDGNPFIDKDLNKAVEDNKIYLVHSGAFVEHNNKKFLFEELRLPLIWSNNEENNNLERGKVDLVAARLDNLLLSHDDILLQYLDKYKKLAVSKTYKYILGGINPAPEYNGNYLILRTIFAPLE